MASADTARLVAELLLKDSQFQAAIRRSLKATDDLDKRMSRIGSQAGKGLKTAGRNIEKGAIAIGAIGVAGLVAATNAAIDFEDAFSGIRKTVDEQQLKAAGLTFDDLSSSIRGMAREIPIAATELAGIGEAAGALGVRAQDIENFTKVVAELSVTTNLTSDEAATALGQLGTTLGLTGGQFNEFADSLVALGNAGASTESQIIDIATRFAAAGRSAGLSKEQILALSSAVASMGIDAESGGSALSRVFNNVATGIGTGSKQAKAFAKALGLSAKDFKKSWDRDALGTFQKFLAKLNTLDQFQAASLLEKVGITNVRDVQAIRLMGQNIGFVNDQLKISETATGALGIEASKKFATTASQIKLLKNNLTDVGITIGNAVLPKIVALSGQFSKFLNTPETQKSIKNFAEKLPGAIDEIASLIKSIPWSSVGSAMELAGTGAHAVLDAFKAMPDWVKTAILTGWGLNKLTGGAVTGIIGELGKGLIKGVLGMNAGVVNINAAVVNGPGGGIPGVPGAAPAAAAGGLTAGAVATTAAVGVILVGGTAVSLNAIATEAGKNNLLAQKGLSQQEIIAQKYYTANKADQDRIFKQLHGHIPSPELFKSGTAKLQITVAGGLRQLQVAADRTKDDTVGAINKTSNDSKADAAHNAGVVKSAIQQKIDEQKRQSAIDAAHIRQGVDRIPTATEAVRAAVDRTKAAAAAAGQQAAAAIKDKDLSVSVSNSISQSVTVSVRDTVKTTKRFGNITRVAV